MDVTTAKTKPRNLDREEPDLAPAKKPAPRVRFLIGRFLAISVLFFVVAAGGLLAFVRMEEKITARGFVVGLDALEVRARTGGIIESILCADGEKVASGRPLGKLMDSPLRHALERQAESEAVIAAELAIARTRLARLQKEGLPNGLRFARIEQRQARVKLAAARAELDRTLKLQGSGIASGREVERARAAHDLVKADLDIASEKVRLADSGLSDDILTEGREQVTLLEQKLANARAERKRLAAKIEHCVLRAPASGEVVLISKKPGEEVRPGELLFEIATSGRTGLHVHVDESGILKVAPGQQVRIMSSAFSYRKHGLAEGVVREVPSMALEDRARGGAKYKVEIEVRKSPFPLKLGSTATADIIIGRRTILQILFERGGA